MTELTTKLPVKTGEKTRVPSSIGQTRGALESLRREIDPPFDEFVRTVWRSPFRRSVFGIEPFRWRERGWGAELVVDVVEKDNAYEITAEMPGMDEKNIEVKLVRSGLTIKAEKQEEKEERKKDYYLHERHFGSFERSFAMPEGVDTDKIEASYTKGVLTVTLPKKPEAVKPEKKIAVKAA